jgi:uncharacterized membrane protein HdeD (DUF308 family)
MGLLAIASAFFAGPLALVLVGVLLILSGILELLEIYRAADEATRRSSYLSGALSIAAGILLLNRPQLIIRGVGLLLGASFLIDGAGKLLASWRARRSGVAWKRGLAAGLVNVALGLVLVFRWPVSGYGVLAILIGIRMLASGWAMVLGREEKEAVLETTPVGVHPDRGLRLPAHQEFAHLESSMKEKEEARRSIDASWCWVFVVLFFAIHVGRMQVAWNIVGMISPAVAVLGDLATALVLAFGLVLPLRLAWRKLTRPLERRAWERALARLDREQGPGLLGRLCQPWLRSRLLFARRMAQMRHSPRAALRWGLQVGLPATAMLIAVNPIWGFNWFFNSESWATGVWDHWAAVRTDHWREKMIEAVQAHFPQIPPERLFQVEPEGVADAADFSFLVLGDTGEGGGAQQSLRDQYLFLGKRPDIKFLVISSDVIYPEGAMSDYEPKFYLPFKGFTKPIYAIPGNHDWYDALEGFAANFVEPEAARTCMLARIQADNRLTSTTENRIDGYLQEAARLRREFGVSTGWQRGPFFEVQTKRFALIVVDTGVLRTVDSRQWHWLQAALERARGKFIMVILGHPLYAGGRYQGGPEGAIAGEWETQPGLPLVADPDVEAFGAVHRLLRKHRVDVVMAGDTHYFEHYVERYSTGNEKHSMLHFVNGGGGAYTSIGTPLDWPPEPAVPDCAFFPRTDAVIAKLDRDTPAWKMPLWLWARDLRGWPATAETLAGAFDYSRAPFFQSFVEIRVEGSANRVRLIPHGANGPLRWRDLQTFGAVMPAGKTGEDVVEFEVPMPRAAKGKD